ncbi:hypothetical protein TNCV_1016231 [Trichonephila clavipes]|uniref:Uncharacterized protein n=1 Tax=Trichonephila clavipes TaxID=2585209 RepID=A0A8X6VXV0_TRICX|nr:hypothetical protein TNCV_1016231 [Trichonephila clavipes]
MKEVFRRRETNLDLKSWPVTRANCTTHQLALKFCEYIAVREKPMSLVRITFSIIEEFFASTMARTWGEKTVSWLKMKMELLKAFNQNMKTKTYTDFGKANSALSTIIKTSNTKKIKSIPT